MMVVGANVLRPSFWGDLTRMKRKKDGALCPPHATPRWILTLERQYGHKVPIRRYAEILIKQYKNDYMANKSSNSSKASQLDEPEAEWA